jgi:hypothetical protein
MQPTEVTPFVPSVKLEALRVATYVLLIAAVVAILGGAFRIDFGVGLVALGIILHRAAGSTEQITQEQLRREYNAYVTEQQRQFAALAGGIGGGAYGSTGE